MLFNVTITIPAYGVEEVTRRKFASVAAAIDDAMDDVAIYWLERNCGNDVDEARELCDVGFSIKVTPTT